MFSGKKSNGDRTCLPITDETGKHGKNINFGHYITYLRLNKQIQSAFHSVPKNYQMQKVYVFSNPITCKKNT